MHWVLNCPLKLLQGMVAGWCFLGLRRELRWWRRFLMCKGILCLSADSLHCGPNYHDEQNLVHYEHDLETYGESG